MGGTSSGSSLTANAGLAFMWARNRDSVQGVTELTQPMRCSDPWYQSFLAEARDGRLSMENYLFIHGAPTSLVGSMIPGEAAPRCGNASCAALQEGIWAERFQDGAKPSELSGKYCYHTESMDSSPSH